MKVLNKNGKHYVEMDDYDLCMTTAMLEQMMGFFNLEPDEQFWLRDAISLLSNTELNIKPVEKQLELVSK